MRAVVIERYAPIETQRIQDVPSPVAAGGQVRVRIKAAGIGFVDGLKIEGLYQTKDPLPFVPGMEFAGAVEDVGAGVTTLRVGDPVFGSCRRGALAEEIVIGASELLRMPANLSFVQAAAIPANYLTAVFALVHRAGLGTGEIVLVLGAAGGTGTAAIKVAKMLGARVIAGASTEEKRSFAIAQGADAAIDYTREDWRETLKSLTGGRAIDVIFDGIGGEISPVAFRTLGWKGRHLVVGFAAGKIPALAFNIALLKGASLVGIDSAQISKWEPDLYARIMDDIQRSLEAGTLAPPAVQTFALADFKAAFDAMRSRRALGKIVVEVAS